MKSSQSATFSFAGLIKDMPLAGDSPSEVKGRVVLCLPKGEVHDIGKTVIKALFKANRFEVIDLGSVESADDAVQAVIDHQADIIGISCMLTSSLGKIQQIAKALQDQGIDTNLMVGGPGLTPAMMACYIAPFYTEGVSIYVKDLYYCHKLCHQILDPNARIIIKEDCTREYEELRSAYKQQQTKKKLLSLKEARSQKLLIRWDEFRPVMPTFIGNKVFEDFDMVKVVDLIDWATVFLGFGLKGKYPQIFKDPSIGLTAKQIFEDAQTLLKRILSEKLLNARAVIGFYPASSIGDDIEVYDPNDQDKIKEVLFSLRQQAQHDEKKPYYALSDFIVPLELNIKDYIGAFALSCGFGLKELTDKFSKTGNDYQIILAKVLADCLAEAFAEYMHLLVRKEYWGYAKDESFSKEEIFRCQFQGIRPAPGYPACPEHSEKETLFRLLDVKNNIAMELTSGYAMWPAASVCGFYFAHPQARYFWLGTLGRDQIEDYAKRKNQEIDFVEQQLKMHLNYF